MTGWINGIGWVSTMGCGCGRTAGLVPIWNDRLAIPARKDLFAHTGSAFWSP